MKRYIRLSLFSLVALVGLGCAEEKANCAANEVACGDVCVDVSSDPAHCGGCNLACAIGEACVEGACTCPNGEESCEDLVPDLFATCFQAGALVPFSKEHEAQVGPALTGMSGPQTMAAIDENHLVVVGSLDQVLRVVDRRTMKEVGKLTLAEGAGGTAPNHVVVVEKRAYVVQSISNEVTAVDLTNPAAPKVVYSVSTGENTSPSFLAMDEEGTLWVTLWTDGSVLPITVGSDGGTAGTPIRVEKGDLEGIPYPSGIAVQGSRLYVALNNLDASFAPAGNGRLWIYDPESGTQELVDLGEKCTNATDVALGAGDAIYVSCTGSWGVQDGALAVYDPSKAVDLQVVPLGGAPTRISVDGSVVYLSESEGVELVRVEGTQVRRIPVCSEAEWEFVSDVLVFP